jgi:hypothetical protein
MTIRTLLPVVAALLFITVQAESADWLNYVEEKDGDMLYIDMDSIERISANNVRIVKKIEPAGPLEVMSVVNEIEMDCGKRLIRYLNETTYMRNGKSNTSSRNDKFRRVTEEDADESLMELVCSLKKIK